MGSSNFNQGLGGPVTLNPTVDQRVFVSKAGSDATGTGSSVQPFLTVAAAMASIADAAPAKRYNVLLGPGTYADPFTIKANTFVTGSGSPRLTHLNAVIALDADWAPNVNNWGGFSNVVFDQAETFDFAAVTSNQGKLFFDDCIANLVLSFNAQSNINQVAIQNTLLFGGMHQQGINMSLLSAYFQNGAPITMQGIPAIPTLISAFGGGTDGALDLIWAAGDGIVSVDLFGFAVSGNIVLNGASTSVDGASLQRTRLGTGGPNGVVTGNPGDLYTDLAGGAGTTLWVKEAGTGTNAGWVNK